MKKALVIGGSNGLGLSIVERLIEERYEKIYIVDREDPAISSPSVIFIQKNLIIDDYSFLSEIDDINTLIYTAGFGRVASFESLTEVEITNLFKVNVMCFTHIIRFLYDKFISSDDFYCSVIGSIAGYISSPLFSIYGATKAALVKFVESINIELIKKGSKNRILNVSPGSLKGTKFSNGSNDTSMTKQLAQSILGKMYNREMEYIPEYEEVYKRVINSYSENKINFGMDSYDYKLKANRINNNPQLRIGYLSGTFDLFHVGHLNLLKRAKQCCDYLVVGVHKDASHKGKEVFIPFEERVLIVESVKYVDRVIESLPEDDDVHDVIGYQYLFVGSDYKGSDRFKRYEEKLNPKGVKIIYFSYTKSTSSTHIRNKLIED